MSFIKKEVLDVYWFERLGCLPCHAAQHKRDAKPDAKPVKTEEKPQVKPQVKPVKTEEKPVKTEEKPVEPVKPVKTEEKPVEPVEPVKTEEKPVEPVEPVEPVKTEAKPAEGKKPRRSGRKRNEQYNAGQEWGNVEINEKLFMNDVKKLAKGCGMYYRFNRKTLEPLKEGSSGMLGELLHKGNLFKEHRKGKTLLSGDVNVSNKYVSKKWI
jgi:histone H3/H4